MSNSMQTIEVHTSPAYTVSIGSGLLDTCGTQLRQLMQPCHIAVITDSTVAPLYLDKVSASLQDVGFAVSSHVFPAGESHKNFDTLAGILEFLAEERLTRTDCLAALGGGVTGDMAGLAAALKADDACVYFQQPNYFGILEQAEELVAAAHNVGAKVIMGVDPISLAILKTPAACGADIAVGEGQSLGIPMGFGGPYLGFMTCTQAMMRRLPGRIVGQTADAKGNRAFVLTIQAREQHIRREKATSSICSNEALCAMTASVYLATMGPQGLAQCAKQCYDNSHYAAEEISRIPGFSLRHSGPFYQEFVTECPVDPAVLMTKLEEKGILGGLPVDGGILWCVTEMNSKAQIDSLVAVLKEVAQ